MVTISDNTVSKRPEKDAQKPQERRRTPRGRNVVSALTIIMGVGRSSARTPDTSDADVEAAGGGYGSGQTASHETASNTKTKHHSAAELSTNSRNIKQGSASSSRDGRKAPDTGTKEPDVRPKIKHQGKEPLAVKTTKTISMLQDRNTAHATDGIKPTVNRPKVKNEKRGSTSFRKTKESVAVEDKKHVTFDKDRTGSLCESDSAKRRDRKTEIKPRETDDVLYNRVPVSDVSNHRNVLCNPNGLSTVVSLHVDQVLIITMNANGPGTADRLREGISYTVTTNKPMLVLFQEFKWIGISGRIWEKHPLPSYYQYFGNKEASLLYDTRHIVAEQLSSTEMRRILEKLQRSSNNNLKKPFPMDFDPLARMCISSVTTIGVTISKFICVSWHGPYRRSTVDYRKDYFSYLLEFLRNIMLKFQSPLLVAGDFNIDFQAVEALIKYPFKACSYRPSARREGSVIDYFITTENLELTNIRFLDIGDHESSFDHDPLISSLSVLNIREQAKLSASALFA